MRDIGEIIRLLQIAGTPSAIRISADRFSLETGGMRGTSIRGRLSDEDDTRALIDVANVAGEQQEYAVDDMADLLSVALRAWTIVEVQKATHDMLDWTSDNTNGEWETVTLRSSNPKSVLFLFRDATDAAHFKLRWV